MREKIRQLAKEEFQYELPRAQASQDRILLSVENGKTYKDSLFITNSENTPMKGLIYCACPYVKVGKQSFVGSQAELGLEICVKGKKAGEAIHGQIVLVTDCGEIRVPVTLSVVGHYAMTSLGKIRDLFQFANLAKVSPAEALQLFSSDEFEAVFLEGASNERILYESLVKSPSKSHAMEEFLIAIHKKMKMTVRAEKTAILHTKPAESFMEKITLQKDTWGYEEIFIQSNRKFLIPAQERIWTDQFVENTYELEYIIDPKRIRGGTNYGKLEIRTSSQTVSVEVTVKAGAEERLEERREQKMRRMELFQNYLNFRLGHIDSEIYEADGKAILEKIGERMPLYWHKLLKAQLAFAGGRGEECRAILSELGEREEEIKRKSEMAYCAFWYLKSLADCSAQVIEEAVLVAQVCYTQKRKWQFLWFLLYVDEKYEDKELRRQAILEQLEAGCNSPALYYELCSLYNQEPVYLKELTWENIRALHWGARMNYISESLALQYVLLAGKLTRFYPVVYHDMEILYGIYETDEILTGICRMLVRNEKAGRKYFPWYQAGVRKQLRITNLYEYYMYSMEERREKKLPHSLLLYFLYDSALNDKKKAFLYSYLVKNKDSHPNIFESYEKEIRQFAISQLEKGNNDESLSVLYEELLQDGLIVGDLADQVAKAMFQYQVACKEPGMRGIYVLHKELLQEAYVPLERGKAIVSLCTEGAMLVFVDGKGNRYVDTVEYSVKKLNDLERYMEDCYQLGSRSPMLLLALCEKIGRYHKRKEDNGEIQRQALQLDGLKAEYRKNLYGQLLEYYYDNMMNEELESLLLAPGLSVTEEAMSRAVELAMLYGLEEQALRWLDEVSWDRIPSNRIQKFVTLILLRDGMDVVDEKLLRLSWHVFEDGKCNKILLKYLALYYEGPAPELFRLWERCHGQEWEEAQQKEAGFWDGSLLERLEEAILSRILFSESSSVKYFPVFQSYCCRPGEGAEGKKTLKKAFLAYTAYQYVVHGQPIHPEAFELLNAQIATEECEVGKIALLKHYAGKKELTEEELQFSDFQLHQFMEKNQIFPFFQSFRGRLALPQKIIGKYYVEYKANPKNQVYISYAFAKKEGLLFSTEPMRQAYPGIFVKDFLLFYGEELDYYIYEEEKGQRRITESYSIHIEDILEDAGESRQSLINFMLLALEVQDEKTLLESMEQYIKRNYAGGRLFWPV